MAQGITVRVLKFESYKGRSDVTHNSWFRLSNRLLEDPDFFDFTHAELLVWVYILSLASQKNSDAVFINFEHAERVCRLKKRDVLSAIEKLQPNQIVLADVTSTVRTRYADDTFTCATEQDKTEQTEQNKTAWTVAKNAPIQIETPDGLFSLFSDKERNTFTELYQDQDFINREALKAVQYYDHNPAKKPKTVRGWKRAFTAWLERSWTWKAKNTPGQSVSSSMPDLSHIPWDKNPDGAA